MSRNGSGVYSLAAGNPVTTGTTISSTWANNTLTDIASALTASIASDGQTVITANLPMSTYAHTGVGVATARTMYGTAGQIQDSTLTYLTTIAGADVITAVAPVLMSAYATGQQFHFIAVATNTTAVTVNINAIGAKSVKKTDGSALIAGDIASGATILIVYDGTNFQFVNKATSSGDVVGPASATDNAVARFDATTGKLIQNSVVTIADTTGNMFGLGIVGTAATGALTMPSGTTAQEPAGATGMIRYNSTLGYPEWYNSTLAVWQGFGSVGVQRAIFGYGYIAGGVSITNLVSNVGVMASDTTGVGTARWLVAASGYGADKAIFGYGYTGSDVSMTNLVSNTGVVATDTTGVGTAREALAAASYGTDKALFGYGTTASKVSMTNLVSNAGVVATDVTGVGTARAYLAAAGYGNDKAIFGYGSNAAAVNVSVTNLVSNVGVVATDTTGVGTIRYICAAAGYGGDKAIFGYGNNDSVPVNLSLTNLVSNTGVVATDTTGVGTARNGLAAAGYGGDKAIFGYGHTVALGVLSMTNLVSNTGVVANDVAGVGTARRYVGAASYSLS